MVGGLTGEQSQNAKKRRHAHGSQKRSELATAPAFSLKFLTHPEVISFPLLPSIAKPWEVSDDLNMGVRNMGPGPPPHGLDELPNCADPDTRDNCCGRMPDTVYSGLMRCCVKCCEAEKGAGKESKNSLRFNTIK